MACVMMALVVTFSLLSPNTAHADERLQLMVMGDSLSAAYNMEQDQGWVALLAERLGNDVEVINASVSGETTSGGAQRFPELLRQHEPDMVLLELGGNDGLRGLSPTQMHDNLADMIEQGLAINAEVILLGIDIPPNYGQAYRDAFKKVYTRLADHYDVPFLPFLLEGIALNDNLMQSDDIHPNEKAQPLIVENVWPVLAPRLERQLAQQTAN
ncbi:arylesterase [Halomonas sp. LS-001]